jgi:hypothetical protein
MTGSCRTIRNATMLIRVVYTNNKFDFVKPFRLDRLLEEGRIAMFRRSCGWVQVGIDSIRVEKKYSFYSGQERRGAGQETGRNRL